MGLKILIASVVAPMDRAPIRDGAVVFDESIIDIGPAREARTRYPDAEVIDAGDAVILPGLVNAHAHLELTDVARPKPMPFADWVKYLISQEVNRPVGFLNGLDQCRRFGMTTVGDITAWPTPVREMPIALNTPRIVSFGEVRAMATRRNLLKDRINAALHAPTTENWRIGISPHAPYSIELEGYQRCLDAAKEYDLALTTHLAETPDETEFLAHHTGPLREIWNAIGGWDEQVPKFEGGPIRFAHSIGLLDYPKGSLAHVNYCDDDELVILTRGKASVIYCPRTHQYFEHPPHRWREMLARGINVAIGTDSCASSPNLNLVDDLRLLHEIAPEVPVQTLWEMATIRAARAIAMDDLVGSITPGKRADFCIFKAASKKPLLGILECDATPSAMFIGGTDIPVGDRTR